MDLCRIEIIIHKSLDKKIIVYFSNKGMEFMLGSDWKNYFDVLIVQARKPKFFTDISRPIRVFDERSGTHIWDRVNRLEKGVIYYEVNIRQMM